MTTDTRKISADHIFNTPAKYVQEAVIGAGGMKTVLRVRDSGTNRSIALAVAKRFSDTGVRHFTREALLTAELEHPNIVPVHEIGTTAEGVPYFTMKLLTGVTLQEVINRLKKRDPEYLKKFTLNEMLSIFLKICDAIDFAHSKKILHLDLKPANIQIGEFGEVLVLDWGLARSSGEAEPDSSFPPSGSRNGSAAGQTVDGVVMGTLEYMPPEQALGRNSLRGPKWDIYSLGAILHAMLTLHPPVEADSNNRKTLLKNVVAGRIRGVKRNDLFRVPASLQFIMYKALDRRPAMRYDTTEDLKKDVERFLSGYPAKAEKAGFFTKTILYCKRRRGIVFLCLSLFFTLFLLFGFAAARLYYKRLELDIYRHTERLRLHAEQTQRDLERKMSAETVRKWIRISRIPETVLDGMKQKTFLPSRDKIPSCEFRITVTLCWLAGQGPAEIRFFSGSKTSPLIFRFAPDEAAFSVWEDDRLMFRRPYCFAPGSDYIIDLQTYPAEKNGTLSLSCSISGTPVMRNFIPLHTASPAEKEFSFAADRAKVRLCDTTAWELGVPLKCGLAETADIFFRKGSFHTASDLYHAAELVAETPEQKRLYKFLKEEADMIPGFLPRLPEEQKKLRGLCGTQDLFLRMEGSLLTMELRNGTLKDGPWLGKLPIRQLRMENCSIPDPSLLKKMHLRKMMLSQCRISGLEKALKGCELTEIFLRNMFFRDLSVFRTMPIRTLSIQNAGITSMAPLEGLSGLKSLDLSGNRIESIEAVKTLSGLQSLNLSGNRIRDLAPLAHRDFRELDLSGNRTGDSSVLNTISAETLILDNMDLETFPLPEFPGKCLRLGLAGNNIQFIPDTIRTMKNLREMDLSGNRIRSGAFLRRLFSLRRLDLSANPVSTLPDPAEMPAMDYLNCDNTGISGTHGIIRASVLILPGKIRGEAFPEEKQTAILDSIRKKDQKRFWENAACSEGKKFVLVPALISFRDAVRIAVQMGGNLPSDQEAKDLLAVLEGAGAPVWFRIPLSASGIRIGSSGFVLREERHEHSGDSAMLLVIRRDR